MSVTLAELARLVNAELRGNASIVIRSANSLKNAGADEISFAAGPRHLDELHATRAGAVVIGKDVVSQFHGNALVVDNPPLAFAHVCAHLHPPAKPSVGIHATA